MDNLGLHYMWLTQPLGYAFYVFHQIWKGFSHYIYKYFVTTFFLRLTIERYECEYFVIFSQIHEALYVLFSVHFLCTDGINFIVLFSSL